MEMIKEFIKTLRENIGAIITALVIFLIVAYYSIAVIPVNERNTNQNYHHKLEEFGNQVTSNVQDYVNHLDSSTILSLAEELLPSDSTREDDFFEKRHLMKDSLVNYGFILVSELDSIYATPSYFNIRRQVAATFKDIPLLITNECNVPKEELRRRLEGSTSLKYWLIFRMEDGAKNLSSSVLLNNGITAEELDSLNLSLKKPKDNFTIGEKHYFLSSILTKDQRLGIIGAVDVNNYNQQIQRFDANVIIICAALVLLLLLTIPLIKPLISSVKERLTQFDMVSATVAICICTMLLSVSIFTCFFSSTGAEKIKKELGYTNQVYSLGIQNEFNSYKAAGDLITKKFLALKLDTQAHVNIHDFAYNNFVKPTQNDGCFYSELPEDIAKQRIVNYFTPKGYTLPDIIFEMDSAANMTWDMTRKPGVRKNYADREYYKKLQENPLKKVVTAVNSRYDNSFKFTFIAQSQRSEALQHPLRGFVYKPFFRWEREDDSYGYMICDETGKVLLHSDTTKRLSENIYSCCHNINELSGFFHGEDVPFLTLDYEGHKHLFHGSRLFLGSGNPYETTPLYLFTFKNVQFEDDLNIYCISKAFVIAVAFGILTGLLLLCYSVFLYHGSLSVFSKTHVYWLFPDKSRLREFKGLRYLNYAGCLAIVLFLWFLPDHALFAAMIIAINLAFVNFVLLSQRAFRIDVKSEKGSDLISAYFIMMVFCSFASLWLYSESSPNLALTIFIIGHLSFLAYLRRSTNTVITPTSEHTPFENNRYRKFLASTMALHYIVVPIVILFSLFALEKVKLSDIHLSLKAKTENHDFNFIKKVNYSEDLIFNEIEPTLSPSEKVKNQHDFQIHQYYKDMTDVRKELFSTENSLKVVLIIVALVLMVILLTVIAGFYTQRFFFFDLVLLTKLSETVKTSFANYNFIIPPFNDKDLQSLEQNEIGKHYILEKENSASHVSSGKKLDLILNKALIVHNDEYVKLWESLNADEKFALYDFATDYFVNYKNKTHVASLIQKGLIISDPVTGRLRIMNYSFRNFILHSKKVNDSFNVVDEENRIKGTFAKWRLPLLIIASSIIILVGIIYKEKSEQIILYSGSIISAVGLVGRFLNMYKG